MRCLRLKDLPPAEGSRTGWPWTEETGPAPDATPGGAPWPRISVVTPSYNQGQFIERTIRSVLLQGYPNLEYVIVDGGSDDGTTEVLRRYEPWLSHWVSEKDGGQSQAINKGWRTASGDILAWLNSDDYYALGTLQAAAAAFEQAGPQVGVVFGKGAFVSGERVVGYAGEEFRLEEILQTLSCAVPQPSAFARASLIRRLNGVAEDLHLAMDWDLWNRAALESELRFFPDLWSYASAWAGQKTRRHPYDCAPEMLRSMQRLLKRKDVPPGIRSIRRSLLAATSVRCAGDYRRSRRYLKMQLCFLAAFVQCPLLTLRHAGLRDSVKMATGPFLPLLLACRQRLRLLST